MRSKVRFAKGEKKPSGRAITFAIILGLMLSFAGCSNGGRAWFQRKMIYFPVSQLDATPAAFGLSFREVSFSSTDGTALHGWFMPVTNSTRAVLVCHGNGGNISHRLDLYGGLNEIGLNVFAFDYRGYGRSEGRPDEQGTYQDALAAFDWLVNEGFAPTNILVLGESLGGAIATELAVRRPVGGLILKSTFMSMPAIGSEIYPFLPVKWICTFKYDTISKLPKVTAPVLVLHSRMDRLIPFHHSEKLFAVANDPKIFRELNGGHNDPFSTGMEPFQLAIQDLIRAQAGAMPSPK